MERALDIAAPLPFTPQQYTALPDAICGVANANGDRDAQNWLSTATAFKTTLSEITMNAEHIVEVFDPKVGDSDWAREALLVEEGKLAKAFWMSSAENRPVIQLLSYVNQAEDIGSISYYLVDPNIVVREVSRGLWLLILSCDQQRKYIEYLDQACQSEGIDAPVLVVSRDEVVRSENGRPMPLSEQTLRRIGEL